MPVAMAIPVAAAAPVGGLRINQVAPAPSNSPPPLSSPPRPCPDATGSACCSKCEAGQ
jgi:hypothetical protein